MPWNPDQYQQFGAQRAQPFHDLLNLLDVRPHLKVVDLGCGTGELTRLLADRLPDSDTLGIDASSEMLAKSHAFTRPGLRFERRDILELAGSFDVIFSNAALQWLPDHDALLARLWTHLAPRGQLAVQVPSNFDHPSHRLLNDTAREFADDLGGFTRLQSAPASRARPVASLTEYAERLFDLGGIDIVAFEKIYPVVLSDADGILAWTRGTALVPYLERLDDERKAAFEARYRERLWQQWPSGPVFYAFKRTLFTARKPA
ncbi:methyltransferase [Deinococcus yavapaiensis]|uniref:Trans-aconitate 2-methyltransferase n=1 Tax=Deinococcus yavapaiensis KR-236 TaxID=694435 RepID=A0A318S7S7_9DEIO|nr:methyltransferase domain-containing protein [Deinococcus yavapaiensis]PYE53096.1 trans-aconitate 2-methyltransferase [Deinococcus yavapaiensis KR-236]